MVASTRGVNKHYDVRWIEENEVDAVTRVAQQKHYAKGNRKETADGKVLYYTCKSQACSVISRLRSRTAGWIFEESGEHAECSTDMVQPVRGMTEQQLAMTQQLYDNGATTSDRLFKRLLLMRNQGSLPVAFEIPKQNQIKSRLKTIKKSEAGYRWVITPEKTFEAFAEANSEPSGPDEPYVCGFDLDVSGEVAKFRMCFTTPRLLQYVPDDVTMVHGDDTHNVV